MILEEYCNYILSREGDIQAFTIPGCSVVIDKNDLLANMKTFLRDNGDKYYDYDRLLVNTLLYYVSKDHLEKSYRFDANMDAIINNIRSRVERISAIYNRMERPFPFSYEKIFEILVYYLRLVTNILKSGKNNKVCYVSADITPEAVIYNLNRKLSMDSFETEWEKNKWKAFCKDNVPFNLSQAENYFKFMLLSTYIRYCEIKGK